MAVQTPDDDTLPSTKSPGNEGARGSQGQANSGAQPGQPEGDAKRRAPASGPDLRDADAQGGGGVASDSSRSK